MNRRTFSLTAVWSVMAGLFGWKAKAQAEPVINRDPLHVAFSNGYRFHVAFSNGYRCIAVINVPRADRVVRVSEAGSLQNALYRSVTVSFISAHRVEVESGRSHVKLCGVQVHQHDEAYRLSQGLQPLRPLAILSDDLAYFSQFHSAQKDHPLSADMPPYQKSYVVNYKCIKDITLLYCDGELQFRDVSEPTHRKYTLMHGGYVDARLHENQA